MANSPYAHTPLRMKYCTESRENVMCEGARLQEQVKNLAPFIVPNTDISIDCIGVPSLVDGKVCLYVCMYVWVRCCKM